MKITKIEPTPSPNVMKLTMDESLNAGVRLNYTWKEANQAPSYLRQLLAIDTVTGVFQTSDFIALERHPKGDWLKGSYKLQMASRHKQLLSQQPLLILALGKSLCAFNRFVGFQCRCV
jgi:hypothetical protein